MYRKLTTLLTAVVVIFAMLPALAASAVTASATLTQGGSVFPGANDYTVSVRNTEQGLFGVGGAAANYIEIVLPPNVSAAACSAEMIGTFRCRTRSNSIVLDGGMLAGGATLAIPFKATAAKPVDRNRTTNFDVRVSEDGGITQSSAGKPATVVRALRILANTLGATAPAGVTDGTGTVGQSITYSFSIENLAQQAIPVTPSLTSNGPDTVGTPAAASIPAGATTAFTVPVTLGAVNGSQQDRTFTANGARSDDPTTQAGTATAIFGVQAAPLLNLVANSFSPRAVRTDGTTYTFSLNANKANIPAVTGLTGSLSFAGNTIALNTPTTLPSNATNGITLSYTPSAVTGMDNVYAANFTFRGVDDNGFPYSQTVDLNNLITIDNIAPEINLNLTIPSGQQQVKDGDNVGVAVTVNGGVIDFVELQVTLENPNGPATVRTIPVNGCAPGATSCNGSATLSDLGTYGTIVAVGQASDAAENRGSNISSTFNIDNVLPVLAQPARIVEGTTYGVARPVVEVTVSDRFTVNGGCNALNWDVDQTTNDSIFVTEVRYSNGTPCSSGTNPGDNIRILVTNATLNPDIGYNVLYIRAGRIPVGAASNPITDGALNRAVDQIVQTISGIAPAIPDLAQILRNGGAETAVFDDDRYWTRFSGADTQAVIRNTRAGYLIEVLDGNGQLLRTTSSDGPNATAIVPIGTAEGDYARGIRLVNGSGLRGPILNVIVALDQTLPGFASSAVTAPGTTDQVTVTFSEILWAGSNRAFDWFARENNTNPGEDPFYRYRPNSVEGSAANTRVLNVDLDNLGSFAGVEYGFDAESAQAGTRYVDRAGNILGDFAGQ